VEVKGTGNLALVFLNFGIILGMVLGYRNYRADKYSLFAIGGVSLLVLNGMFFAFRRSPDLPPARLRRLNRCVVWPIAFFATLVFLGEWFCAGR
jgi:hypothetical protein